MAHWSYGSFFYHIYPLGFCGAPQYNDFSSSPINRLEKISGWIPHLKDLGIKAIYLGPVFESTSHGYDTADYYTVDRRLGTNETLAGLVYEFHDNGMKVILDGVFNHVGRNFWAFKDVLHHQGHSIHCDWIHGLNFHASNSFNDPFSYSTWEGHDALIKLNLENYYVREHIFKAVESWINNFNIDGLRLDVAYCLNDHFLKELRNYCKNIRPDFWLMGEVLHGDYRRWANPDTLDSVTNYDCYKGIFSSHNCKNYYEIASTLNREFAEYGLYNEFPIYNFVDNHDVDRVASTLHKKAHLYPLYAMLMTIPGIPSIYYGSEFGLEGTKAGGSDTALRPDIDFVKNEDNQKHKDLYNAIKRFASIRKNSEALKYGIYRQVGIANEQLAFIRQSANESLIVAINGSDQPARMDLYDIPVAGNMMVDILNDGETYYITGNRAVVDSVPPNWARIMRVQ